MTVRWSSGQISERSIVVDRPLSGRPVSEDIIAAVATASDSDPLDLPQLGTVIDPDALDGLFDWDVGAPDRGVRFQYADFVVQVVPGGQVKVADSTTE